VNDAPRIGIGVPDVVAAGEPFTATVVSAADPYAIDLAIHEAHTGRQVARPRLMPLGGAEFVAELGPLGPGLYRLSAGVRANTPVTCLFLVLGEDAEPAR
jgi:hypothetical protein